MITIKKFLVNYPGALIVPIITVIIILITLIICSLCNINSTDTLITTMLSVSLIMVISLFGTIIFGDFFWEAEQKFSDYLHTYLFKLDDIEKRESQKKLKKTRLSKEIKERPVKEMSPIRKTLIKNLD